MKFQLAIKEFECSQKITGYIENSMARNTKRAYSSDWRDFVGWCGLQESLPADPATVADYISGLAGHLKAGTIKRRIVVIGQVHIMHGFDNPANHPIVKLVWQGIKRKHGVHQEGTKPILVDDLQRMVDLAGSDRKGLRDKALLLIGFAGAFRRSELVALQTNDIEQSAQGLIVTVRNSKTDQEGNGRRIGIPWGKVQFFCPVHALQNWLKVAGIDSGFIFRRIDRHGNIGESLTPKAVSLIVKEYASIAGMDVDHISGHSLRSGLATSAASAGVDERTIMNQTGHKSVTTLRRYIREGSLFRDNAASGLL